MIEYLTANWGTIVGIIGGFVGLGTLIVKLTPSNSDNEWWNKWVLGTLGRFGFLDSEGKFKVPGPHPSK